MSDGIDRVPHHHIRSQRSRTQVTETTLNSLGYLHSTLRIYLPCAIRVFNQVGILNPPTNPSNSLPNSFSKASSLNPKLLFPSALTLTNSSKTPLHPPPPPGLHTTICRVGTCNNLYPLPGFLG